MFGSLLFFFFFLSNTREDSAGTIRHCHTKLTTASAVSWLALVNVAVVFWFTLLNLLDDVGEDSMGRRVHL